MNNLVETVIPGRSPIELVAFYEEFRDYYPQCELETKQWFVENVDPDWWIFDIGANIGYYSILFAQLAHRGRVLAFEPTITADMLRRNLRHHRIENVEVHEIALGASTGPREDRIFRVWGTEGEVKTYPFSTLDDFVAQRKPQRVDCLKIDVDSFDFEVLRGAERTIEQYDPIIMIELNDALTRRHQRPSEVLQWLASRGFDNAVVLDRENFMLSRHRPIPDALKARKMDLFFPAPRPVQEHLTDGVNSTDQVVSSVHLEAGITTDLPTERFIVEKAAPRPSFAALFRRRDADCRRRIRLDSFLGSRIETTSTMWSYALVLDFHSTWSGSIAIELSVEVFSGKLGIVFADKSGELLLSRERLVPAADGVQHVVLTATKAQASSLVLRTAAYEGSKTAFCLRAMDIRLRPR